MIPIDAMLDHTTRIDAATTGTVHDDLAQLTEDTATDLMVTNHIHHTADHPNIEASQVINPEIAVDHIHNHPIDLQDVSPTDEIHISVG